MRCFGNIPLHKAREFHKHFGDQIEAADARSKPPPKVRMPKTVAYRVRAVNGMFVAECPRDKRWVEIGTFETEGEAEARLVEERA